MPSACRLTTLPEVALCQLPEVSQDVHYRDNGVFIISGPSISLRKKFTAECTRETIFAQALGRTRPRPSRSPLREHTFPQEYDRRRTIPRAAAWPMADSLAGPKWFNLAKEQSANHMAKTVWFIAGVTRGIGTEITKAVLVDSNQVVASDRKPEVVTKALGTYL